MKKRMSEELYRVRELLAGMVSQHCVDPKNPHQIFSYALSANESAIDYLEEIGWLELVPIKLLRWILTEKAYKPDF